MELWARDKFSELSFYTWGHPDTIYFIHQYIVDAFEAQTADKNTKPITKYFPLLDSVYTWKKITQADKFSKHI